MTFPVKDQKTGLVLYLVNVSLDITENKKAEKKIKDKIEELERYKKLTIERELKMIEMKKEINGLYKQLNQKSRYDVV
jgi:ribosome assembly protein YihI (activator of Der GTPase)